MAAAAAAACAPCLWRPCLPGDAVTDPRGRSSRAALRPLHSAAGAVSRPPCVGRGRAGGAGRALEGGFARPGPQGRGPPRAGPGTGGRGARRGGGGRRQCSRGRAGGRTRLAAGVARSGGPPGRGLHNHRPAAHGGGEALRDPPSAPSARPARRAGRPGPRRALGAVLRGGGDLGRPGAGLPSACAPHAPGPGSGESAPREGSGSGLESAANWSARLGVVVNSPSRSPPGN